MTTTYQKRKFGKHPKITVYIDGPFFPDSTLTKKSNKKLHDQVFEQLKSDLRIATINIITIKNEKLETKMNIMFCGDSHAEDGILIATLSLLKIPPLPAPLYLNYAGRRI